MVKKQKEKQLPLMPMATAVWLIDNSSLTFRQIGEFCGLHHLEVKGIADGEVAAGIQGMNPITGNQLEASEIERCQQDPSQHLRIKINKTVEDINKKAKKTTARYTPIARRQDKPDGIYWLLKNYPDISDGAINKLIGTTKNTVEAIRNRDHWNMANIRPRDPVLLGLCTQVTLNKAVSKFVRQEDEDARSLMNQMPSASDKDSSNGDGPA